MTFGPGYVSFLVGSSAQFIEDEDIQFRNSWVDENGFHQLFLLKTGVWWLLTINGEQKIPSGVSLSDQEALTSLLLRQANLPADMKERATKLRKSLKKTSLSLQRRFVTAVHPDFGFEAVVFSADDFVDSEWKALMDAIEESCATDHGSIFRDRYRFRLSATDSSLATLAALSSQWQDTKDIRNAVFFDFNDVPKGFAKRNESTAISRSRADAIDRVAAKIDRVAMSIRELRESAGTASIADTPFVPLRDAKSVKVLDLDTGKEVWLQLDEYKEFSATAFKDYVDEKTNKRICERETLLISGAETYHLYD